MIRGYHAGDLETCRSLWAELTEWHRTIYNSPTIGGDDPGLQFDEHLVKVGPEHIWLAEIEGEVVGMVGLIIETAEDSPEIEPVIVVPQARGTGAGRQLVEHVLEIARGLGLRDVTVRAVGRNAEAIRFYHDLDFDTIGYVGLFHDLRPAAEQPWRESETIADRRFRV
jgi:N-acetylglutamate synthase-like GNAT family acetyltransferase